MRKEGTRKRQLGRIEYDILEQLTAGDLLYGFLLSAHSTPRMFRLARERATYRYRRKCALDRLVKHGLASRLGETVTITEHGRSALGRLASTTHELLATKRWDGKWRIVSFDIPQEHAPLRRTVRTVLKRAGFALLQQSLWVFPHDCEELAHLIQRESRLKPYILYGVLDRIEGDEKLRKTFRL